MPEALRHEIKRLVGEAAQSGDLDVGEALKRLFSLDEKACAQRRELINELISESLRAGVTPQLPIV